MKDVREEVENPVLTEGIGGLRQIASVLRKHTGTSQTHILTEFLASLYDGREFPFALNQLRRLDDFLAVACIAVAQSAIVAPVEIHRWGVITDDELWNWMRQHHCVRQAEKRRISERLYQERFGERGHSKQDVQF